MATATEHNGVGATQSGNRIDFGAIGQTKDGKDMISLGDALAFPSVNRFNGTKQFCVSRKNKDGDYERVYLSKAQIEVLSGYSQKYL